jgi:integrase
MAYIIRDKPKADQGETSPADFQVPPTGNRIFYDDEVKGFGVRVTAAGARSFILNYRVGKRERRHTIGSFPDWSVKAARDFAKDLKVKVDMGGDPVAEKKAARDAVTVGELCDEFIAEHLPSKRPATARDYRQIIDTYIRPSLKHRPVSEITYNDAVAIHRKVTKAGKGTTANRTIAIMSVMFNEAVKLGWATANPTKGVDKNDEVKRERFLDGAELDRLLDALDGLADREAANIFRLILLTGARKTEVLAATWDMFDLGDATWTKPSHHTKQKKTSKIPLSAPARLLLSELYAAAGDERSEYVFPAHKESTKETTKVHLGYRQNVKNQWAAVIKAAKLPGLHIHDLRHSYASFLVAEGLSLPLIGRLLGHTQAQTTARYAHIDVDPLRKATQHVGNLVASRKDRKAT